MAIKNPMQYLNKFLKKRDKDVATGEGQLGIYIATDGVAIAHVKPGAERPILDRCEYIFASSSAEQSEILIALGEDKELKNVPVNVILQSPQYEFILQESPNVSDDELEQALKWGLQELVPYSLDDAIISSFKIPVARASDAANMVYAVVAKKAVVDSLSRLITGAKLNLSQISIPELALLNISKLIAPGKESIAMFRVNAMGGKLLYICDQNIYMTRNIDLHLESLFNPMQGEDISGTLHELATELQRSIDYCVSYLHTAVPDKIVFTPVSEDKAEHVSYVQQNLSMGAEIVDFNKLLDVKIDELGTDLQINCQLAIGAALREKAE